MQRRRYTKAQLKQLFSDLQKKRISDGMMHALVDETYNEPVILRTSGFYAPGAGDSVMTWDDVTRKLLLEPLVPDAGGETIYDVNGDVYVPHFRFYVWERGPVLKRRYAYDPETSELPNPDEIELPNEEGLFAIYYDQNEESLTQELAYVKNPTYAQTAEIYLTRVIVAWVYWDYENQTAIYFGDSRHGSEWNPQIHWSWHKTLNSVRQEGIAIVDATYNGDGSENAHYQFGISAGKVWHEDILDSTEAVGLTEILPVWYVNASGLPRYSTQTGKKFMNTGTGRVAFNSGGLAEATTDYYVLYHLFATNCIYQEVISVMGKAQFEQLGQAIAAISGEVADLRQEMPHSNLMWIDTIIIQTSDDYANAAKARIVTNACTVMTEMSVTGDGSALNKIKLVNDEDNPDDLHYYGTGDAMEPDKGFHHLHSKLVTQAGHGFAVKQAIRHNGTAFVLAQANNAENAQTTGIVVEVIDVNNFRYQSEGFFAHVDWVAGKEYALSPATAGQIIEMPNDSFIWQVGWVRQSLGWGTDRGLKIEIDVGDEIGELLNKKLVGYWDREFEFCINKGVIEEFIIDLYACYEYTVVGAILMVDAGTVDASIQLNGVNVTGLENITITTTPTYIQATGNNVVVDEDMLKLVTTVTYTGDPVFIHGKLKILRE